MFTGIVEGMARVSAVEPVGEASRLHLDLGDLAGGVSAGDSVCVGGCCLTVESIEGTVARFTAIAETLARSSLGGLAPGDPVNIERSLKVGDEIGGHFVFGHVDGLGEVVEVVAEPAEVRVRVPADLEAYLVSKGSIAIDGVSLTIASVDGRSFSVALIPFTLEATTLGRLQVGDRVNLETDYLARVLHKQRGGEFERAYSGAPWEEKVGYCRALRAGDRIFVTGTAAVDGDGQPFAPGDAGAQTTRCLEIIEKALGDLGADRTSIVRTRLYVTDISRWEEIGRAHGEFFAGHHPTTTMVEISALVDPAMLVEIEADAVTPA